MVMGKCGKIRHIVLLRQMVRGWRRRAAESLRPPSDVPAGHVAVCVGRSSRRYVVRAAHLNHPVFRRLLAQVEEEFGFPAAAGPLSLPSCDETLFEEILRHISSSKYANIDDFKKCCCCHAGLRGGAWHAESLPLLGGLTEKLVW